MANSETGSQKFLNHTIVDSKVPALNFLDLCIDRLSLELVSGIRNVQKLHITLPL